MQGKQITIHRMGLNYPCFQLVATFVNNVTTIDGLNTVCSVGLIFLITCVTHVYTVLDLGIH